MKEFTLILIGVIGVIGIALIAPVMNDFAASFPAVSETMIALVVTMPSITMLVGLFAIGVLTKINRKKLLLCSLMLTIIGGVLPAVMNNFYLILVARGILGLGMGLGLPLQMAYFAEYQEDKRAVLLALNTTLGGIVSTGLLFLIAMLKMPWRSAFLLYALFAVIFIMCLGFLPKDKGLQEEMAQQKVNKPKIKLSFQLVFGYIMVFFLMAQYFIVPTTIAFYLESRGLGGVDNSGIISGCGTFVMALTSLAFPILRKFLGDYLNVVVLILGAGAFVLYAKAHTFMMIVIAYCLVSMIVAILPVAITMKITQSLPLEKVAAGAALFTGLIFLGQFISPYYQLLFVKLLGGAAESTGYVAYGGVMLFLAIINFIAIMIDKKGKTKNLN